MKNTIVAHSLTGGNCVGVMTSLSHNLDSGTTCGFSATGDLSNTAPQLGPLQDNGGFSFTHALLPGSPAIEVDSCPAFDVDKDGQVTVDELVRATEAALSGCPGLGG